MVDLCEGPPDPDVGTVETFLRRRIPSDMFSDK
jgi:hypothetical protein